MKNLLIGLLLFWMISTTDRVLAAEPIQQLFGGWQVSCNNLDDCDIRSANENMQVILQYLAEPRATITLELMGYNDEVPSGIWLDGILVAQQLQPRKADNQHDYAGFSSHSLPQIQRLIAQLPEHQQLSLSRDGDESIALPGLLAALKFVDKRQKRTGYRTALVDPGLRFPAQRSLYPKVEHALRPPPLAPAINNPQSLISAVLKSQQANLRDNDCDPDAGELSQSRSLPLNQQLALVMIKCVNSDWQSSDLLFIVPRRHPEKAHALCLSLPLKDEQGEKETISWFTDVSYDPNSGLLTHTARGRGIADCGERAIWHFDGTKFQLMSYHNQPTCDGGEPGNWPSVWLAPGFSDYQQPYKVQAVQATGRLLRKCQHHGKERAKCV